MTRQVFFDPFGSYAKGADSGMRDQMALEQATRAARQTDWSYYNTNPLDLQNQQLQAAYNQVKYPYDVQGLPIQQRIAQFGLYNAGMPAATNEGNLGNNQPYIDQRNQLYPNSPLAPEQQAQVNNMLLYSQNQHAWEQQQQLQVQRFNAEADAKYRAQMGAAAQIKADSVLNGSSGGVNGQNEGIDIAPWLQHWGGGNAASPQGLPTGAPNELAPTMYGIPPQYRGQSIPSMNGAPVAAPQWHPPESYPTTMQTPSIRNYNSYPSGYGLGGQTPQLALHQRPIRHPSLNNAMQYYG